MKAALAKILKDVAKKKIKKKIANASSFFSGEEGITGIVALTSSLLPIAIATVIIIGAITLPILLVQQFIADASENDPILFNKLGNLLVLDDWCKEGDTNCEKQATQNYYEELEKVYNKYKEKNVQIDVQLITATIFYADTHREDIFEDEDTTNIAEGNKKLSDIETLASNMVNGNSIDYDKYRNYLTSTYIPNRFSSLYSDRDDKQNAIEEIADYIMGFKNETTEIAKTKGKSYINNLCPEICTSSGKCYDLETYVAGVVAGESGWFSGGAYYTPNYKEQWKAQAVAARTYALARTDWCKNPIGTDNSVQVLNANSTQLEEIKEAISETQGQVITYEGEIFWTEYDSFYMNNNYHCDSEECYATYIKKGPTEALSTPAHEIASYAKWKSGYGGGHGRGMSQFGAAYLADKGWKYEDILKYYYVDNIELSFIGGEFSAGEFTDGLLFPLGVNSKTGTCVSAGNYYSPNNFHGAVDIAGVNMGYQKPYEEIPVIASIGGKITVINTNQWCTDTRLYNSDTRLKPVPGCIGNNVTILVTDTKSQWYNYQFIYYHLDSVNPDLKLGDEVSTGEFLGYMGSTGNSSGFHLHYDIRNPDGSHFNDRPVGDYVTNLIETYCKNNKGS